MPFSHAPVSGQGNIIVQQIQSPNFNEEAQTGWRISKDGSAYFADIQLPDFQSGTTVTFSSTAPANPNPGDIWYNIDQGLEANVYSGTTSTWVPYQIGTQAIANGAITTDLIAGQAVNTAQLADGAVTGVQIADNAVGNDNIQDLIITANKFNTQTHTLF